MTQPAPVQSSLPLWSGSRRRLAPAHSCECGPGRHSVPFAEHGTLVRPAHILGMSRTPSDTLDLFAYNPPATARTAPMEREGRHLPAMSDREVVALLGEVIRELERRAGAVRATPDLSRALEETQVALRRLSRGHPRRNNPAQGAARPLLHPAKRRAVRAALVAGVKPREVAKHFGLSLTEVRKALAEIE